MSERITARLKEFRLNASAVPRDTKPEVQFDADVEERKNSGSTFEEVPLPKVDKGKGRAVEFVDEPATIESPPPMSPALPPAKLNTDVQPTTTGAPIVIAGVSFTPGQLSQLLSKAKEQLPLRSVRFPLLGEYQEAFTGEEFAAWLKENVKQFEGSLDRAEDAETELTESHNLLRRLGELGNEFEDADDAWYQFRAKVQFPSSRIFWQLSRANITIYRPSTSTALNLKKSAQQLSRPSPLSLIMSANERVHSLASSLRHSAPMPTVILRISVLERKPRPPIKSTAPLSGNLIDRGSVWKRGLKIP